VIYSGQATSRRYGQDDKRYRELLMEYRVALGFLSGLRMLYSATSPKVAGAAKHLRKLEHVLATYRPGSWPLVDAGIEPATPGLENARFKDPVETLNS